VWWIRLRRGLVCRLVGHLRWGRRLVSRKTRPLLLVVQLVVRLLVVLVVRLRARKVVRDGLPR
jgi:hypothetical protein